MDAAPRRLPVFSDVHARLVGEPSDTLIACHACDYTEASEGCQTIQMLGHSMRAVAIPKGGELTYRFEVTQEGPATLFTAMIPTQPYDQGDLRYAVQLDDAAPVIISLRGITWSGTESRSRHIIERRSYAEAQSPRRPHHR